MLDGLLEDAESIILPEDCIDGPHSMIPRPGKDGTKGCESQSRQDQVTENSIDRFSALDNDAFGS